MDHVRRGQSVSDVCLDEETLANIFENKVIKTNYTVNDPLESVSDKILAMVFTKHKYTKCTREYTTTTIE